MERTNTNKKEQYISGNLRWLSTNSLRKHYIENERA